MNFLLHKKERFQKREISDYIVLMYVCEYRQRTGKLIYVTRNDGMITISIDYVLLFRDCFQHEINTKIVNITSIYGLHRISRARTSCVNFSLQTVWFDSLDFCI